MRGSVIRLIAGKEFRDLLRDRRTVILILVLPAVLYPLFGLTGILFAASLKENTIAVVGAENLPPEIPLIDGEKPAVVAAELNMSNNAVLLAKYRVMSRLRQELLHWTDDR